MSSPLQPFYGIIAKAWKNEDIGGVLTVFGLVPLATGLMGSCSLYTVFKLNTVEGKDLLLDWSSETLSEEIVSPHKKLSVNA